MWLAVPCFFALQVCIHLVVAILYGVPVRWEQQVSGKPAVLVVVLRKAGCANLLLRKGNWAATMIKNSNLGVAVQ